MAIRSTGDIIAENYIISSSVTYMTQSFSSGSTTFGNSADDKHVFTGSLQVSSSVAKKSYIIGTNVGIGTTAPESHVTIVGGTIDTSPSQEGTHFGVASNYANVVLAGNTGGFLRFHDSDNSGAETARVWAHHGNNKLYLGDDSADMVTLDLSNGRLGIGTTSPTELLNVSSSANNAAYIAHFRGGHASGKGVLIQAGATNERILGLRNYAGTEYFRLMGNGQTVFSGNITGSAYLEIAGNVSGSSTSTGSFG